MLRWVRNLSLRWLLAVAIGLPSAVVAFQVIYFPSRQSTQSLAALTAKARTVAELVAHNMGIAMNYDDLEVANTILRGARQDDDLHYVIVLKADGSEFASLGGEHVPVRPTLSLLNTSETEIDETRGLVVVKSPIRVEKGEPGLLLAGFSTARVIKEREQNRVQMLALGGLVLFFGLAGSLWLGGAVGVPLIRMIDAMKGVADGDLTRQVQQVHGSNEVASMSVSFNAMLSALRRMVNGLRSASLDLSESSQQILASAQEQEQGANEQTASMEEISHSVSAVADTARAIAERGQHLAEIAEEMLTTTQEAAKAVETAAAGMSEIVVHQKVVLDGVNRLYEQSRAVISVVDLIDDISDRLDLLALNAALEGSRAGEMGKGFSLVALEMRRLAENVSGSTRDIKRSIEDIQRLVQSSLDANQQGSSLIGRGEGEMQRMSEAIARVFDLIQRSTEAARQIGITTRQQLTSSEQTVKAVQEIGTISAQSARAAQEVTGAASKLTELAVDLRNSVTVFKLGHDPDLKDPNPRG